MSRSTDSRSIRSTLLPTLAAAAVVAVALVTSALTGKGATADANPYAAPAQVRGTFTYATTEGIHLVDAETGEETVLTAFAGHASSPAASPDGERLVFAADLDDADNADIYVSDIDGTDIQQLTATAHHDTGPEWSPDGTRIAFERNDATGRPEIAILDVATGAVTLATDNDVLDVQPEWSPDGTELVFTRNADGQSDLVVLDVASSAETVLATPESESGATWSPDGESLAYVLTTDVDEPLASRDLWAIDLAGEERRPLVETEGVSEMSPRWTDDGSLTFVVFDPEQNDELIVARDLRRDRSGYVVPDAGVAFDWSPR